MWIPNITWNVANAHRTIEKYRIDARIGEQRLPGLCVQFGAECNMEALSCQSSSRCVNLQPTAFCSLGCHTSSPCMRCPGALPSSRAMPSMDTHSFAGSSGASLKSTAPKHIGGRRPLICAAGAGPETLPDHSIFFFPPLMSTVRVI